MAAAPAARLERVRALARLFREAQPRETAEESVFRDVLEILTSTSSAIEQACQNPCGLADLDTCLLLTAECFRCLRNACVECAKNQHVMRNLGLISTSVHLIKLLHGIQIKEELLLTGLAVWNYNGKSRLANFEGTEELEKEMLSNLPKLVFLYSFFP